MRLKTVISGKTYQFKDVKDVLAKANEEKSGDILAGIAASSGTERIAAKEVLSNLLVSDLRENPVVPYEQDDVTRIIQDAVSEPIYNKIRNWTIGELRELMKPENYVGRSSEQVVDFINDEIKPVLERYRDELGVNVEISV